MITDIDTNKNLLKVERAIDYVFSEPSLIRLALTHSSYANEHNIRSNENLEFFGDSILNMIISEYIYNHYHTTEGEMSVLRSKIVSEPPLSRAIDNLNIIGYLQCGVGEARNTIKSASMKADLFEAIVAAIYLDSGNMFEPERFIMKNLRFAFDEALGIKTEELKTVFAESKTKNISKEKTIKQELVKPQKIDNREKKKAEKKAKKIEAEKLKLKKKGEGSAIQSPIPINKKEKPQKEKQPKEKPSRPSLPLEQKKEKPTKKAEKAEKAVKEIPFDYKTLILNAAQKKGMSVKFEMINEGGVPHKPIFEMAVLLDGKIYGSGTASRKKQAEQIAAKTALEVLEKN